MKILVIHKYPVTRKGIAILLQQQYPENDIIEVDATFLLEDSFKVLDPELIIFSIDEMNKEDRLDLLREVKYHYPSINLISIDHYIDLDYLSEYVEVGVNGYIEEKTSISDFLNCVRDVLEGKAYMDSYILIELIKKAKSNSKPIRKNKLNTILTNHEHDIATYLVNGVKTSVIAKKLGRKPSTISTIKSNIFKKLEVDNIVSLKEYLFK